jgi:hypothetical protein
LIALLVNNSARAAPVSARRRRLSISPSNVISSRGQLSVLMTVHPAIVFIIELDLPLEDEEGGAVASLDVRTG